MNLEINKQYVWIDPEGETSTLVTLDKIEGDVCTCFNQHSEIECNVEELRELDNCEVCNFCGNIDIEHEAWVKTNSLIYVEESSEPSYWCDKCQVHPVPITMTEYLDSIVTNEKEDEVKEIEEVQQDGNINSEENARTTEENPTSQSDTEQS